MEPENQTPLSQEGTGTAGHSTSKWWWLTLNTLGWSREEIRAGWGLLAAFAVVAFPLMPVENGILHLFGLGDWPAAVLGGVGSVAPAILLARPIVTQIAPERMAKGDSAA
ncbi:MAG TPA: hypothetical protein VET85_13820, partial [Stellaceae bacterium]|nr:hypothetical protein [Stellaceae bacterium]